MISSDAVRLIITATLICVTAHSGAVTELLYDSEPNDAPHEAVAMALPSGKDAVRIIGELEGQDQDAYRIVVDEDLAGRRFNLQITGRGGALTRLDIFDFTELADGRGRIPAELSQKPTLLMTLKTTDGSRPGRADGLLLAPGVYVLGVSHSGGEGSYSVDIDQHDDSNVTVIGDNNSPDSPQLASTRGKTVVWTQGETWFDFEIKDEQAKESWDLAFQSPLGRPASLKLLDAQDTELLTIDTADGLPVHRPGLSLDAGRYRFRTDQKAAGVQMLRFETGAPLPREGREVEPNDRSPNPVELGQSLAGRFDDTDTDWLSFEVGEADVGRVFDLELSVDPEAQAEVCLVRDAINLSHCVRGADGMTALRTIGLTQGSYRLRMHDRKRVGTDWQLEWVEHSRAGPGEEVEPNDDHGHAVALHERGFGRGHFNGRETDHWRFSVRGEAQLWRLQLQGKDLFELTLKNSAGKTIVSERAGNNSRVRLDNVFLMPGEYLLAAVGTDSDYVLRLVELGPPPEGMEMEPNDEVANANRLHFGVEHFGTLAEKGDTDRYQFTLSGHERIRLTVQPPVDGSMRGILGAGDEAIEISDIRSQGRPGEALQWDMFLAPADYSLTLTAGQVSDAEYTVVMERLDYLDRVADREPNGHRNEAAPFPFDGQVLGSVGHSTSSEDWYLLPIQDEAVVMELPRQGTVRTQVYGEADPESDLLEYDREQKLDRAELAPGQTHWLQVKGKGEYHYDLSALADLAGTDAAQPVEVDLRLDHDRIAAFSPWAQRLAGELTVTNRADQARTIILQTHVTDVRWQLDHSPGPFELGPEESTSIALTLDIPPDIPALRPARMSVHVHDKQGSGRAMHEIAIDANAPPVEPVFHWPVPEALRGNMNAAASNFGAAPAASPNIDEDKLEDTATLYDGLARVGRWTEYQIPWKNHQLDNVAQPTVRLAGSEPIAVAGFAINPTANTLPQGFLRDFAVAVSLDGEQFDTVLTGKLEPIAEEQYFVLDAPVHARYARLLPLAPHYISSNYSHVRIGEFKVLGESGWRPHDEAFNLADPNFGGHLVWSEPWIRGSAFDQGILLADDKAPKLRLSGETRATVVLGFHHARAASIDGISVLPMAEASADLQPAAVSVAVSDSSPIGPWRQLAEAELAAGETRIDFDERAWARYVKLDFEAPEAAASLQLPDRIAVYETAGESILGEWGHYTDIGPYEASQAPEWSGLTGQPANINRDTAVALGNGDSAPGRALLDTWSAWYRLDIPTDNNHLTLRLSGTPSVEAKPRMMNAAGEAVELYALEQSATEHHWEAYVEPGQSYWVEVFEPPRSVIFSWDTSGSVAAYLPTIANALRTYAETIEPGRDEVNLLPFGRGAPLLKNWQGHAYPLMKMLSAYPHDTSSSDAERAVAVAAEEMVDRPGKKAVLLLTDAATITDASLWPALHDGQPQVFAMKLSSEGAFGGNPFGELDLMQDWARVRGGHFDYVTSLGALSNGFDRAVARLKAPVDFAIQAEFAKVDDPTPATIAIVSSKTGADPGSRGAVEIILDASGSMLKRMGEQRRIDIAKAAIRRTVSDTLPDGMPLALRVYGHREAGSCRTDLEVPLAPLDKSAFLAQIEGIQAINLAKTPIADSLAAVAADLKAAEGRRLVVLLTDGEETCDGDPATEIEKLKESGFEVRVNIVGFAINDDELKRQFADWAEIGGGEYLDASDADGLDAAVQQALQIPFVVIDAAGEEVARGLVDADPIELPAGRYSVRIESATPRQLNDITLAPGDGRLIELD
ncbi:VWA domain-containing protein [Wenzhouxiangella sp. XN201]|uniref:VWA domain-containing protein n=1 Tax=Wenzhouxiangella sp. XN201 TaxID=2710755 RepID=UPI0013CC3E6D|nr:VWA domain-containing protein [Wenzhouxiangella sp. XN201]NEZ04957.1 VWA domain-containing protein [Wenzhouxiangella sp. XN201]